MSCWVPSHAASAAQRRDRAAFHLISLEPREHWSTPRQHLPFICPRTPTRCDAENMCAKGRWRFGSGGGSTGSSAVPPDGTRKSLIPLDNCAGSSGSSENLTREACACMRVPACVMRIPLFTGTTGTCRKMEGIERVTRSNSGSTAMRSVEPWNRSVRLDAAGAQLRAPSNKIGGGYSAAPAAPLASADQRYCAGDAPRNFRGLRGRDLAAIAADRVVALGGSRIGGFQPFLAAGSDHVGMGPLECTGIIVLDQGARAGRRKPARFTRHAVRDPQESPPGVGRGGRGVEPPFGARLVSRTLAQPVFSISIDLLNCRRLVRREVVLNSIAKMGSGVCHPTLFSRSAGANAHQKAKRGARDQGVSGSTGGQSRGTRTLWAGCGHVN